METAVIRTLLLLTALLLPTTALAVPAGVPLWEDAATGMDQEEVLARFPEARALAPDEGDQPKRPEQGKERVRIPEVEIAGERYRAGFYFLEGALARVVLEMPRAEGMPFSRGLKLTEEVRDALTQTYGEPASKDSSGKGYMVEWRDGPTVIRLVVLTQTYKVKKFEIIYEAAPQD
ncbi:hypothetical protein AN478_02905 [Thiohalorhabdus denitrificans]|nr:hypothetical protein AN478_02905 [Thiohalorhabdus denitrificans]